MKHAFLILILTAACNTEIYNDIPCDHDFTTLHDSLKKFGLSSYGESPVGFKWKEKYDSAKLDCGTWDILIGVDSCNEFFFDEKYVLNLADLVFNEPLNKNIHTINFELKQCHYGQGHEKLFYQIKKDKRSFLGIGELFKTKNAKIIQQLSEGHNSVKPEYKFVTLLLDSLPSDPYFIASEFAGRNKQYREIHLVVENINSPICKRIEFSYGF